MTALASGRPEDGEAGNMISMKIKGERMKYNLAQPVSNIKEGRLAFRQLILSPCG